MKDEKAVRERIKELEAELASKQQMAQQAQKVLQQSQADLIGLQGALFELKKIVDSKESVMALTGKLDNLKKRNKDKKTR